MTYVVLRSVLLSEECHVRQERDEVLVSLDPLAWGDDLSAALRFEDVKRAQAVAVELAPPVGQTGPPTSVEDEEWASYFLQRNEGRKG